MKQGLKKVIPPDEERPDKENHAIGKVDCMEVKKWRWKLINECFDRKAFYQHLKWQTLSGLLYGIGYVVPTSIIFRKSFRTWADASSQVLSGGYV